MMLRISEEFNTKFISFSEYVSLCESFKPKETEYGTDGKDGKWNENETHYWTFFSHKPDHHAIVHIGKQSGEFGFGTHKGEFSTDAVNHYDESPKHLGEALSIMNKATHVALDGAKKHNINTIHMHGANENLRSVYDHAVKNKFLQKHLAANGFEYSHSFKDRHYFKRI